MQRLLVGETVQLKKEFIIRLLEQHILEEQRPTFGVIADIIAHHTSYEYKVLILSEKNPELFVYAASHELTLNIDDIELEKNKIDDCVDATMTRIIRFSVAPYALFDVLNAFKNTRDHNRYLDFGVTKEDNELSVWVVEKYIKAGCCGKTDSSMEKNDVK